MKGRTCGAGVCIDHKVVTSLVISGGLLGRHIAQWTKWGGGVLKGEGELRGDTRPDVETINSKIPSICFSLKD